MTSVYIYNFYTKKERFLYTLSESKDRVYNKLVYNANREGFYISSACAKSCYWIKFKLGNNFYSYRLRDEE